MGMWRPTGALATARYIGHTATLLPSGKVLVAGGIAWERDTSEWNTLASAEVYDPATGTWSPTGALATARIWHTATLLPSGKVLVTGGYGSGGGTLASAEVYDLATGTWSPTSAPTTARGGHPATLLPDGKVLVAGGEGPSGSLASAEVYQAAPGCSLRPTAPPSTTRSAATALTPAARQGASVTSGGGEIF
jgi:N-acetylneuraminic acid mutarotase